MDCLSLKEFYGLEKISAEIDVDPMVEPQMGWKTGGKPAPSPTKVASDGVLLVVGGNIQGAKEHAKWLMEHSTPAGDALFFDFQFGFQPSYPYSLTPPWHSGLTQGFSLALFSYLYKETGEKEYLDNAEKVFKSYLVPIEKGGFTRFEADGPFFEEYPTKVPIRVFNGAIRAMLALHDYGVISGNRDAIDLFRKSVERFKKLLPRYEVADKDTKVLLSAYSLAPARADVLGRFVGDGNIRVFGLKVIGEDKNGKKKMLASVKVGSEDEGDVMRGVYVWAGEHMNWGKPEKKGGDWYREANGQVGQYNHSPFIFALPSGKYARYGIEVDWEAEKDGRMDLQFLDGKEFHLIGSLKGGKKRTKSFFYVSDFFTSSYKALFDPRPKVNNNYLDANLALVTLLGRVTGEDAFRKYSERWKGSVGFVPADTVFKASRNLLKGITPVTGEFKSKAGSPSVLKDGDIYRMYYSAPQVSGGSNIYSASSSDGIEWKNEGKAFDSKILPRDASVSLSDPSIVEDPSDGNGKRYRMFYKYAGLNRKGYNGIGWAYSGDGVNWTYGGSALSNSFPAKTVALDPDGKGFVMFLLNPGCGDVLLKSVSNDGISWSAPASLAKVDNAHIHNISALSFEGKLILFVESMNRLARRHEVRFYIYNNGRLVPPAGKDSFIIDRDWEGKWDSVRTGYRFFHENGKAFAYFTGYPDLGLKDGGRIGQAEIDPGTLRSLFIKKKTGLQR